MEWMIFVPIWFVFWENGRFLIISLPRHRNAGSLSREFDFIDLIGEKGIHVQQNAISKLISMLQHQSQSNWIYFSKLSISILYWTYIVLSIEHEVVNKNIKLTFHDELHFIMIGVIKRKYFEQVNTYYIL